MTMQKIPENLGMGGAHLNRSVLRRILEEHREQVLSLQSQVNALATRPRAELIRSSVVNGAAASTNIAVPGVSSRDVLLGVVKLDFSLTEGAPNTRTWDVADLLSEASITSGGNIQLTTDTTGAVLIVTWQNR